MAGIKGTGSKLGLSGVQENLNTVFFIKNNSIYARKQGDFVSDYQNSHNTVFGVDAADFRGQNSDKNTAVGYGTGYNDADDIIRNVFVGYQAGKNTKSTDSIFIGSSTIPKEYGFSDRTTQIGSDIQTKSTTDSVLIGHKIINKSTTSLRNNTIVGAENKNTKDNTIIYGYKNDNTGRNSTIIGNNIKNTGNDVLLINPRDSQGRDLTNVTKNDYVNIFGIIEGSNNKLNISQGIDFNQAAQFASSVTIRHDAFMNSNIHVSNNAFIDNEIHTNKIIANDIDITSNLNVTKSIIVHSNVLITSNLSIGADLFIHGSNLQDILQQSTAIDELNNAKFLSIESNIRSNEIDIAALEIATNAAVNQVNAATTRIDDLIQDTEQSNSDILNQFNDVKNDQLTLATNINSIIEDQITNEFDTIIQKSIDGTYVFNIVRDSLTNFPSFAASSSEQIRQMQNHIFDYGPTLNLNPAQHQIGDSSVLLTNELNSIQNEVDSLYVPNIHTSNVILHENNIFKNRTYFLDKVFCSNNVALHSNLFIKGAIQSFSNQVYINDSLLVSEALHVSDFIQTNALKSDFNFNNYIKCFCNLSFSNDWYVETRQNPNNADLKDLVFRGTHNSETTFTDFIPGQLNFTGQHRCSFSNIEQINEEDNLAGYIVSSTGIYKDLDDKEDISIDDAIPIVSLSKIAYDKKIFGVISGHEDDTFPDSDNKRCFQIGTLKFKTSEKKSKKLIVNAVGEGGIWVCGQNGDVQNGDLIVTSDIPGVGMKQDDDVIKNYTVAKATCDVIFKDNEKKFIGCIYKI